MDLIKTYLGFAIKKRAVLIGVDNIVASRKPVQVILYSSSLAPKSKQNLIRFSEQIKNIEINDIDFIQITSSESIKAIAVFDKNLANAIINNL